MCIRDSFDGIRHHFAEIGAQERQVARLTEMDLDSGKLTVKIDLVHAGGIHQLFQLHQKIGARKGTHVRKINLCFFHCTSPFPLLTQMSLSPSLPGTAERKGFFPVYHDWIFSATDRLERFSSSYNLERAPSPVSYTHLDVYKRQSRDSLVSIPPFPLFVNTFFNLFCFSFSMDKKGEAGPVPRLSFYRERGCYFSRCV